jgi:hypothetical protein
MSIDPFVVPRPGGGPRQRQNVAPGVNLPAARAWRPGRPGDLSGGQPSGALLGSPGPNVGYALTLARRVRDRLALAPHEDAESALAVVAAIAMRRAAILGRAPVADDVEFAMVLLGYRGGCEPDFARWRAATIAGAHHEYPRSRQLVDRISSEVMRTTTTELAARAPSVRAELRAARV